MHLVAVEPDLISGTFLLVIGVTAAVGLFLMVVVLESALHYILKWGSLVRSVVASVIMNVVSAVPGIVLGVLVLQAGVAGFLLAGVLSILIEGGILLLMNSRKREQQAEASRVALMALAANGATYILLACPWALMLFGQQPGTLLYRRGYLKAIASRSESSAPAYGFRTKHMDVGGKPVKTDLPQFLTGV